MRKEKNGLRVYIPLIAVVVIVIAGVWYWYDQYTKYITSDDAHIDADNVSVSSKILGRIVHLYADEGDSTKQGKLIAELDSTDLVVQRNQFIANKQQAVANLNFAEAKYKYDQENIKVQEIAVEKANEDYNRAKSQLSGGVITQEQYDHTQKAYETAQAQLESARIQINVSKAQVGIASSTIVFTDAQIKAFETQIRNTRLYAPMDGIIAKRWLLTGDISQPGQALFTITNNKKLWVVVFLEETKISQVHMGQEAEFTIDAFSGITFTGKVFSMGTNTASLFSLIPPNNASGNFTKVTQRVPLKISIEKVEGSNKIQDYRILTGMSVVVKIIKGNK